MRIFCRSLPLIVAPAIIPIVLAGCGDDPARAHDTSPVPEPSPFVRTVGSTGHDEVHDVAVDPAGTVFVTGALNDPADFDGTTFDPAGGSVFVAKFDPAGGFLWIRRISGAFPDGPLRLGTDDSGDVNLQGGFAAPLTIDGTTVTSNGGGEHVFVARLSGAGTVRRISFDAGKYASVGFGMRTGRTGVTAVTGFIQVGATFGDTDLTAQGYDFFLVRYDSRGNADWAKQSDSPTAASGGSVAVDPGGNVVVAGNFVKSFSLGGIEITADAGDSFLARYNAAGDLQWLLSLGEDTAEDIHDIATGPDGDIYVAGRTETNTMWKLDPDGNQNWELPAAPARDMVVDTGKNILLSGWFQGTLIVGDTAVTSNGFTDFFAGRVMLGTGTPRPKRRGGLQRDPLPPSRISAKSGPPPVSSFSMVRWSGFTSAKGRSRRFWASGGSVPGALIPQPVGAGRSRPPRSSTGCSTTAM